MTDPQAHESEPAPDVGPNGEGREADRVLAQVLTRLDQVEDEHQRFLAEARRQIFELHVEALSARATADEEARLVVASARAEAEAATHAAREECESVRNGVRNDMVRTLEKQVRIILEDARRESDELLAGATAEAEQLRVEAIAERESILDAAQAEGAELVDGALRAARHIRSEAEASTKRRHPSENGARPARSGDADPLRRPHEASEPVLRRLGGRSESTTGGDVGKPRLDQVGPALERLSGSINEMASGASETEPGRREGPEEGDPSPEPVLAPLPLIGSRGQQTPPAPVASEPADAPAPPRPFEGIPTRSPYTGSHRPECADRNTADARRGWRFRNK